MCKGEEAGEGLEKTPDSKGALGPAGAAVSDVVTNTELSIKTLKGLSASCVDVVFNVKCTLFFFWGGDKYGTTTLKYLQNETYKR